jgi:hypothetical protein
MRARTAKTGELCMRDGEAEHAVAFVRGQGEAVVTRVRPFGSNCNSRGLLLSCRFERRE